MQAPRSAANVRLPSRTRRARPSAASTSLSACAFKVSQAGPLAWLSPSRSRSAAVRCLSYSAEAASALLFALPFSFAKALFEVHPPCDRRRSSSFAARCGPPPALVRLWHRRCALGARLRLFASSAARSAEAAAAAATAFAFAASSSLSSQATPVTPSSTQAKHRACNFHGLLSLPEAVRVAPAHLACRATTRSGCRR